MTSSTVEIGTVADENRQRAEHIARIANAFDSKFEIPGLGLKLGYDSLLGLIPGIGDTITSVAGGYIIYHAAKAGARKRVLARMTLNTVLDSTLGAVPLLGDVFDMAFRSNTRNAKLALKEMNYHAAEKGHRELIA
jgi:hypothetical protein